MGGIWFGVNGCIEPSMHLMVPLISMRLVLFPRGSHRLRGLTTL